MDLLITNALMVTCDDARRILDPGWIRVAGNRIAALGEGTPPPEQAAGAETMDARGLAVLPGFMNAHTHTPLTVLRGTVEDWMGNAVYFYMMPVGYEITAAERRVMAQLGCLEAIRSGCTVLVEPSHHIPEYGHAMAATGLRLWLSENCADMDTLAIRRGEYCVDERIAAAFRDRCEEMIGALHGLDGGRVQCQMAAHAPDNCSPAMLRYVMDMAAKHRLTRAVHLAQSMDEVRAVRQAQGLTPAGYLGREGFLGPDLTAAHWTFCDEADVELLAAHGVHMANCPPNNSRRGPHLARMDWILDRGVNVALGSDNMTEDMFQVLKIGLILHWGNRGRELGDGRIDPQPQDLLDGITRNAARSVGALDEVGSLEPGKKADLTLLDMDTPAMRPIINPVSNIVHYGHPGIVHSVMADGRFLLRDRQVLTLDEKALLAEAQAVTQAVWRRLLARNPDIPPPPGGMRWLTAAP